MYGRVRFPTRSEYSLRSYSPFSVENCSHWLIQFNGENVVDTIAPSFFSGRGGGGSWGSSSNLQVTRGAIKSQMSSNSGHICLLPLELHNLECWKNVVDMITSSFSIGSLWNLQPAKSEYSLRSYSPLSVETFSHTLEWPSVWERAVHSVYRECLS